MSTSVSDQVEEASASIVKPLIEFAKNSVRLVNRCSKPDAKGEKIDAHFCLFLTVTLQSSRRLRLPQQSGFVCYSFE